MPVISLYTSNAFPSIAEEAPELTELSKTAVKMAVLRALLSSKTGLFPFERHRNAKNPRDLPIAADTSPKQADLSEPLVGPHVPDLQESTGEDISSRISAGKDRPERKLSLHRPKPQSPTFNHAVLAKTWA